MKRLILTADDFGISPEVNEAVERAHRSGVLGSASLMVGAPAAEDAIARARAMPSLAVGLHVVLVHGRPVLAPQRVPDLVNDDGEFLTDLVRAGFRFFLRPRARAQLAAEVRAQFELFARTGLTLDHADAQSHMHVHPTVFATIVDVGREFGLRAVRIPREPFGGTRTIAPWVALMRRRARNAGLATNDFVYGVNDVGALTEGRLLRVLERLPDGTTEIFFHPAVASFAGADAGTESYRWSDELAALTSPTVRAAIDRAGIERVTYGDISRW
ncbi:MAG TPA: hopanoid biosynthesis-associated protein HpnK [Candidatus Cybelea sp.]|nr:hopanoid biosynthesis-associated protein HpnK [Candidatus Cybelea sp.]